MTGRARSAPSARPARGTRSSPPAGGCEYCQDRATQCPDGKLPPNVDICTDDRERSKIYPVTAAATVATGRGIEASMRATPIARCCGTAAALPRPGAAPDHGQLRNAQASEIKAWLAANPGFTSSAPQPLGPGSTWWEIWFSIIERQAIHRGTFASVRELMIKIRTSINGWNDRSQPSCDQDRRPNSSESEPSKNLSCDPLDRPGAIVNRYQ